LLRPGGETNAAKDIDTSEGAVAGGIAAAEAAIDE
jgi:hypothetical protein